MIILGGWRHGGGGAGWRRDGPGSPVDGDVGLAVQRLPAERPNGLVRTCGCGWRKTMARIVRRDEGHKMDGGRVGK